MAELVNEFSWSRSRASNFEECARRYWFTYYGSWGGWKSNAPPRIRQAYVLKQLQSRWMWVGDLVHQAVARALVQARAGRTPAEAETVDWALERMRGDFRASRAKTYRERPKKVCGLFEHEYGIEMDDAAWGEVADHARACIAEFYRTPYVQKLPRLPRGAWLPVEELASFSLDGTRIFVKPDFAYRTGEGTAEIIDWKTGRRDEEADPIQLACYALYALEQKWAATPEGVVTTEYNLALGKARESRMSAERLEEVKSRMRSSIAAMKELLDDPGGNVATESRFPVAESAEACRRCNYLKICSDAPGR